MLYQEKQSLINRYTALIVAVPVLVFIFLFVFQKLELTPLIICVVAFVFVLAISVIVLRTQLSIQQESDGLQLDISFPFRQNLRLQWNEIESVTIRKINPFTSFGGWGVRYKPKTTGFIFQGNSGAYLKTKSGRVYAFTITQREAFISMVKAIPGLQIATES